MDGKVGQTTGRWNDRKAKKKEEEKRTERQTHEATSHLLIKLLRTIHKAAHSAALTLLLHPVTVAAPPHRVQQSSEQTSTLVPTRALVAYCRTTSMCNLCKIRMLCHYSAIGPESKRGFHRQCKRENTIIAWR